MNEASANVDATADEEPLYEWDRDNPDLSVGICYPSMADIRLAVKQHAIVSVCIYTKGFEQDGINKLGG